MTRETLKPVTALCMVSELVWSPVRVLDAWSLPSWSWATKLHLSKADNTASLQVLSKLVKCPNPDSHSSVLCRF